MAHSLQALVAALKSASSQGLDERAIFDLLRPSVLQAIDHRAEWLQDRMYVPDSEQGFSLFPVHEEPDHTLAVFVVSWLSNRGTPPHDHGTWSMVAGAYGVERNTFWERTDDGSREGFAEVKAVSESTLSSGEVLEMPSGTIHSVWNDTAEVTISLHIYGKHINYTGRSQYDPVRKTATRFISKIESAVS